MQFDDLSTKTTLPQPSSLAECGSFRVTHQGGFFCSGFLLLRGNNELRRKVKKLVVVDCLLPAGPVVAAKKIRMDDN